MGARFYDPVLGRWLSEDPVQDRPFEPATLNLYVYVVNNPMALVDSAGTDPFEDVPPDMDAARKAGEEKGKKQIADRRVKEAIDAAARVLKDALERYGVYVTIEQARKTVTNAWARANAGILLPPDWEFRYIGGGTLLAMSAITGTLAASHLRHARTLDEFLITVFVEKAFIIASLLSGIFGYNAIRTGDPLKNPHRRR